MTNCSICKYKNPSCSFLFSIREAILWEGVYIPPSEITTFIYGMKLKLTPGIPLDKRSCILLTSSKLEKKSYQSASFVKNSTSFVTAWSLFSKKLFILDFLLVKYDFEAPLNMN